MLCAVLTKLDLNLSFSSGQGTECGEMFDMLRNKFNELTLDQKKECLFKVFKEHGYLVGNSRDRSYIT